MAKNKKRKKRNPSQSAASGVALAGDADEVEPSAPTSSSRSDNILAPGDGAAGRGSGQFTATSASGGGFFHLYKPGQGYYVRVATAIGAGLILLFGANYVHAQLSGASVIVRMGVPSLVVVGMGLLLYWIVGSNRNSNDFFIATEGEMKKVSWSTRGEVAGSTKVVLFFTLLTAGLLFVIDLMFMAFFGWINVLEVDLLTTLFGGEA